MNSGRAARSVVAAATALLAGAAGTGAATLVVDTLADVVDAADGRCSLREAVLSANLLAGGSIGGCAMASAGADVIELPAGTYTLAIAGANENSAATGDLDIRDDLTIRGGGQEITIIDGAGLDRVLHVDPAGADIGVVVRDLTIRGGAVAEDNGGCIANFAGGAGGLSLFKTTVTGCMTDADGAGGGILSDGVLVLTFSEVSGNDGGDGAGIFTEGGSTTEIRDSRVGGNTSASSAGGINNQGTLTIERSLIDANQATATGSGGGILSNGQLTIDDSTLSGNMAGAAGFGGALRNSMTATLTQVTVAGNTASSGGGVYNEDSLTLDHTILAGNSGGNCAGLAAVTSAGYNLEDGVSCGLGATGDQSSADPQLAGLADNGGPTASHALPAASPAVDAGDPADAGGLDQRSAPRAMDGGGGTRVRDIGAFELGFPLVVGTTDDGNDALPGDGLCETAAGNGICPLRAAVQEANALSGLQVVELGAGTYSLALDGSDDTAVLGDLDVTDTLEIAGAGPGVTIVDGQHLDRLFDVHDGAWVELRGLTLRNGTADRGGCLRHRINDDDSCGLLLSEVEITGCVGTDRGGALRLDSATRATIVDSSIHGNQTTHNGGGIQAEFDSRLLVRRSTLAGNVAGGTAGGGIESGFLTLWNSTVSGNTAGSAGGGVFVFDVTLVAHSTVAHNTAVGGEGGGFFLAGDTLFHNSIVANNTGAPGRENCDAPDGISRGFNLESTTSCGLGTGGDVTGADPKLVPLADNGGHTRTHLPAASSPAIDTGDPDHCPATDQRGVTRPEDGSGAAAAVCDKGAVEALACQPLVLEGLTLDSAFDYAACESITVRDLLFGSSASGRLRAGRLVSFAGDVSSLAGADVEVVIDGALGTTPP